MLPSSIDSNPHSKLTEIPSKKLIIAIVSAMGLETEPILHCFDQESGPSTDRQFSSFDFKQHTIILARCGIGKIHSTMMFMELVSDYHPDVIIFCGVAGGVDPKIKVGSTIIATDVIIHDFGASLTDEKTGNPYILAYPLGAPPLPHIKREPLSINAIPSKLLEMIQKKLPKLYYGRLVTGDQFINSVEHREQLFKEYHPLGCDMESGSTVAVGNRFGVVTLIIRSISDLAGEKASSNFAKFSHEAACNAASILPTIISVLDDYFGYSDEEGSGSGSDDGDDYIPHNPNNPNNPNISNIPSIPSIPSIPNHENHENHENGL